HHLHETFEKYDMQRQDIARKLTQSLIKLEEWNKFYLNNPPCTDEGKEKYKRLLYNLSYRHDAICSLLRCMKEVTDKRQHIQSISDDIEKIICYSNKYFVNADKAICE